MPTTHAPLSTTVTRTRTYQTCPACGRLRIGKAAIRWPDDALVCPPCSDQARSALAYGIDNLSPPAAAGPGR